MYVDGIFVLCKNMIMSDGFTFSLAESCAAVSPSRRTIPISVKLTF